MEERKQIKFTVVPDDSSNTVSESTTTELKERKVRTYANFCGISHTPFDFALTFCEMEPPTEKLTPEAGPDQELKAPVKARVVVPIAFVPILINLLQERLRACSESGNNPDWSKPPVH